MTNLQQIPSTVGEKYTIQLGTGYINIFKNSKTGIVTLFQGGVQVAVAFVDDVVLGNIITEAVRQFKEYLTSHITNLQLLQTELDVYTP